MDRVVIALFFDEGKISYFNSSGALSAKERYSAHPKVQLVLALIGPVQATGFAGVPDLVL